MDLWIMLSVLSIVSQNVRTAKKISSVWPRRNEVILSSLWPNYSMSDQRSVWDVSQPMSLWCEDDKQNLFPVPRKCQARPCTFVPSLIQMSLKILSCVANMAEDIDSLGLGCKWLFMESIDSAVQLGWTTLHAQNVLLLLLSSENQRGSFSHWKSIQITVEVLVLPCRAGTRKIKMTAFTIRGSCSMLPSSQRHEIPCEETPPFVILL